VATRPINTDAIEKATGKSWKAWLGYLEAIGAADLSHKEIARRISDSGEATGWWAQSITVAYEQHIGRRVPGQDHCGAFQVTVTKTIAGSMDEAMRKWRKLVGDRREFADLAIAEEPRISETAKWRNWRVALEDGSRIVVAANQKTPEKAGLAIAHEKLTSQQDVERWRAFWKDMLARL